MQTIITTTNTAREVERDLNTIADLLALIDEFGATTATVDYMTGTPDDPEPLVLVRLNVEEDD